MEPPPAPAERGGVRSVATGVLVLMALLASLSVVLETSWVGNHNIKAEAVKIPVQLPPRPSLRGGKVTLVRPIEASAAPKAGAVRDAGNRTVLLLRAHKLNDDMIKRLALYCSSCQSTSPPVSLWLSLDTTAVAHERERILNATRDSPCAGIINYHVYSSIDMRAAFPKLAEVKMKGWKKWRGMSLALGYHTEAIELWRRDPRVQALDAKWVWIMELDVGFTAPIADLITNYSDTATDFITHRTGCKLVTKDWLHRFAISPEYAGFVPKDQRHYSLEMTQRFSMPMLNEIGRRSTLGAHAWSEQVGCSTAKTANFTIGLLHGHHIGYPFTFRHGKRISEPQFAEIFRKAKSGRLYHPVK